MGNLGLNNLKGNMGLKDDLEKEVKGVLKTTWATREGQKVPEADDIKLGNDAVKVIGTVLYADLAESTNLVDKFNKEFAAEVYKSYLICACRVIRANGGIITAFDGDRVMAIYMGKTKNTSAVKSALQINYAVREIINKKIKEGYPKTTYILKQTVGVDTSELFVVRTGIRGANDLVWVGRAANYAAKLSSLGEENYSSYITGTVCDVMLGEVKYNGTPQRAMWEERVWTQQKIKIYRSNWKWPLG